MVEEFRLFVDVLFGFQAFHQRFPLCFERIRRDVDRKLHLLDRQIIVALGHGKTGKLVVGDPVVRVLLDIGPEDFESLFLFALLLELPSLTVQVNGTAQR